MSLTRYPKRSVQVMQVGRVRQPAEAQALIHALQEVQVTRSGQLVWSGPGIPLPRAVKQPVKTTVRVRHLVSVDF